MPEVEIHGWARRPRRLARVSRGDAGELIRSLHDTPGPGLPRGAGMSYGDAALAPHALELVGRSRFEPSRDETTVRVDASLTIGELCRRALEHQRFPAVVPGTSRATVGGCLAADVHGKNHLQVGSFGAEVESFELVIASGERRHCSRSHDADLFRATIGGMGWTGIIESVELRLPAVAGPNWRVETRVGRDLEALIGLLDETPRAMHVVGWIDPQARGGATGRGYLERAEPVPGGARARRAESRELGVEPPIPLFGPRRMRAVNELIFARARWLEARGPRLVDHGHFHWPFERVLDWNRWYGPGGFVQLHFVVPRAAQPVLAGVIERAQLAVGGAFAGILKRFGPPSTGLLSFPMEGLSLALDLPSVEGVEAFAREVHRTVAEAGGRIYLAKDALLDAESFRAMYSGWPELQRIKARVDPSARFRGDQAARLGLFSG